MAGKLIKSVAALLALGVAGAGAFLFITRAQPLPDSYWAQAKPGDVAHGALVFSAAGCASCHAAAGAKDDQRLVLSGGRILKTAFGTFHVPNISPSEEGGIGSWSLANFGNAVVRGVDDEDEHLYPALPYGSYSRMSVQDVADLYAYIWTLPKSDNVAPDHELAFPYNIRLMLGGWKFLFYSTAPRVDLATKDAKILRGQYLVEGPGHCGECHTPRNMIGGFVSDQWLAGAPNPDGPGKVPNITPGSKSIGSWSEADIATYLETGFTPDFDAVGGSMVEVQKNIAQLPAEDRQAIAAYLKAIPAR